MKKTVILLILSLCASWPAYGETDPKTRDFLETINAKYYCLSRLGLKNFTVDVSFTTYPESEDEFREPYTSYLNKINSLVFGVSITDDGKVDVTFTPPSSFNPDNDMDNKAIQFGNQMVEKLKTYLKHWAHCTVPPLLRDDKDTETFTVQNTPDGFSVTKQLKAGSITYTFDHQSKLLSSVEWLGDNSFLAKEDFLKTEKGYVLNQMHRTFKRTQVATKYEYQTIGPYQLLKRIRAQRYRGDVALNGIYYDLAFSNYKINQ
jgi:hypothetical protein